MAFHNADNGFAVLETAVEGHSDLATVVGHLAFAIPCDFVEANGRWGIDRDHRQEIYADSIRSPHPGSPEEMELHLGSEFFNGIGFKTADEIAGLSELEKAFAGILKFQCVNWEISGTASGNNHDSLPGIGFNDWSNVMTPGDHLVATDTLHTHHGIYLGPDCVAQYGSDKNKRLACVEIVTEEVFARGRSVHVLGRPASFSSDEIRRRAESRLGERRYSMFGNNCEHFVNWCRSGQNVSRQVDRVIERAASAGVKVAARVAAKGILTAATKHGGKIAAKSLTRAASGWLIVADAAQLGTEIAMSHRGTDPEHAESTGRAVGLATSVGIGILAAGPLGAATGGGLWLAGELAGKRLTAC